MNAWHVFEIEKTEPTQWALINGTPMGASVEMDFFDSFDEAVKVRKKRNVDELMEFIRPGTYTRSPTCVTNQTR